MSINKAMWKFIQAQGLENEFNKIVERNNRRKKKAEKRMYQNAWLKMAYLLDHDIPATKAPSYAEIRAFYGM